MQTAPAPRPAHRDESRAVRFALISVAGAFLVLFLLLPLVAVFAKAFEKGAAAYVAAIVDPTAMAAIRLTLIVAAIVVPINLVFGLSGMSAEGFFSVAVAWEAHLGGYFTGLVLFPLFDRRRTWLS